MKGLSFCFGVSLFKLITRKTGTVVIKVLLWNLEAISIRPESP